MRQLLNKTQLNKEKGFTLVELVVVMAIVSMALALGGYGVSVIFQADIKGTANEMMAEMRNIRYKTMTEPDVEYAMVFTYNSGSDKYGYIVVKNDGLTQSTVKTVTFKKSIRLGIDNNNSDLDMTFTDMSTLNLNTTPQNGTFRFDSLYGGASLTTFGGTPITVYSAATGADELARIEISSVRSDNTLVLQVVQLTGRVNLE